jgi:hypothetical protein
VWSDTGQEFEEARIIFLDTEVSNWSWDPVAKAYYWHRFFACQPDLNFDNPRVMHEIKDILKFWLDLGVDGFRWMQFYLVERDGKKREFARDAQRAEADPRKSSATGRIASCWPRRTSRRKARSAISARGMNAIWRFISC